MESAPKDENDDVLSSRNSSFEDNDEEEKEEVKVNFKSYRGFFKKGSAPSSGSSESAPLKVIRSNP